MSETLTARAPCITIAVGFDKHTIPLVKYGAHLCQKLGKELCLLHVIEPWLERPHSIPRGDKDPFWNVTQAVETNAEELASRRLDELTYTVWPGIKVRKKIVKGKTAPTLCEEAFKLGSMLLIVGADLNSIKFLPKGLSTALSLMVSARVPVMVADGDHLPEQFRKPFKVLMADDLSPGSEEALGLAFDLAIGDHGATLNHVHINGMTFDALEAGLITAASSTHTPFQSDVATEMVFESLMKGLDDTLNQRCQAQREYLEASSGHYEAEVLTGPVAKTLQEYVDQVKPDVIVFGRHKTYHREPFFIGRIPFRTMLANHIPTVVVPPLDEA